MGWWDRLDVSTGQRGLIGAPRDHEEFGNMFYSMEWFCTKQRAVSVWAESQLVYCEHRGGLSSSLEMRYLAATFRWSDVRCWDTIDS